MHNSCLGISPKYLIFRNAPKPINDLCSISFLCANFETFTIFSSIVLKTCTYPPYYRHWLEQYRFVVSTLALGFEDKFRSVNQMDGISIADGGKMVDS